MEHLVFRDIARELQKGKYVDQRFRAGEQEYIRRWIPQERLILLGGGHIAQPLCSIGAMLGFSVTIVDDRPDFANRLRFLEADQVLCGEFGAVIDELAPGPSDFVCVITRGHRYDADCLRHVLAGEMPKYLGMIGSKRRVAGLMEMLKQEGYERSRLEQICAPIGLDIHAQTTAEIAVSIAAQLIQYRRNHDGADIPDGCLVQTNVDVSLLKALTDLTEPLALAVVLATQGSTPVKSGAMMAVGRLGRVAGTVGGGCGEAQVIGAARPMAGMKGQAIIQVRMDNDAAADEGMACGGSMEVLIEGIE